MQLYCLSDREKLTLSQPMLAENLKEVEEGLKELNPENLKDLDIVPIMELETVADLLQMRIYKEKAQLLDEILMTYKNDEPVFELIEKILTIGEPNDIEH